MSSPYDKAVREAAQRMGEGLDGRWRAEQRRKRKRPTPVPNRANHQPSTMDPTGAPDHEWHKRIPATRRYCLVEDDALRCLRPIKARGPVTREPLCPTHYQREWRAVQSMKRKRGQA